MLDFTTYSKTMMEDHNLTLENLYGGFSSTMDNFMGDYESLLEKIQTLKEEVVSLKDSTSYLSLNNGSEAIDKTLGYNTGEGPGADYELNEASAVKNADQSAKAQDSRHKGWYEDETGWYYQNDKETYAAGGWQKITDSDGKDRWYYFNDQGYAVNAQTGSLAGDDYKGILDENFSLSADEMTSATRKSIQYVLKNNEELKANSEEQASLREHLDLLGVTVGEDKQTLDIWGYTLNATNGELTSTTADGITQLLINSGILSENCDKITFNNEVLGLNTDELKNSNITAEDLVNMLKYTTNPALVSLYTALNAASITITSTGAKSSSSSSSWEGRDAESYEGGRTAYVEGSSYASAEEGWHEDSDGRWWYANGDGTYATDAVVDGYTIGADGYWIEGRANGIEGGPITYTGLTMLHGTPSSPEYVLNSDQAYSLLRYMSTATATPTNSSGSGDTNYNFGGIVMNGVNDPENFWRQLSSAVDRRSGITRKK